MEFGRDNHCAAVEGIESEDESSVAIIKVHSSPCSSNDKGIVGSAVFDLSRGFLKRSNIVNERWIGYPVVLRTMAKVSLTYVGTIDDSDAGQLSRQIEVREIVCRTLSVMAQFPSLPFKDT